jgi:hypothetical protein
MNMAQSAFDLHGSEHIRSLSYPFYPSVRQTQFSGIGLVARIVIPEVFVLFVSDQLFFNM